MVHVACESKRLMQCLGMSANNLPRRRLHQAWCSIGSGPRCPALNDLMRELDSIVHAPFALPVLGSRRLETRANFRFGLASTRCVCRRRSGSTCLHCTRHRSRPLMQVDEVGLSKDKITSNARTLNSDSRSLPLEFPFSHYCRLQKSLPRPL